MTYSESIVKYYLLPVEYDRKRSLPFSVGEVGLKGSAWNGGVVETNLETISDIVICNKVEVTHSGSAV